MNITRAAEWGVFEQYLGTGVISLDPDEIPEFVHCTPKVAEHRKRFQKGYKVFAKKPIVYFYGEGGGEVRIDVEAPHGELLYYWPEARCTDSGMLSWSVQLHDVVPEKRCVPSIPTGDPAHWFYRLRESNALWVESGDEIERFLFYEYDFARMDLLCDHLEREAVDWCSGFPMHDVFVLKGAGHRLRWLDCGGIAAGSTLELADLELGGNVFSARGELTRALRAAGLSHEESRHLLEAWSPWLFSRSERRLVGILDRAHYDELLPLRLDPEPDELIRVGLVMCVLD